MRGDAETTDAVGTDAPATDAAMTSAEQHVPSVPHAIVELVLREPADARERALAALRHERLVGLLVRDDLAEQTGALRAVLVIDETGVALTERVGEVVAGLALTTIAARLSRALDAEVDVGLEQHILERLDDHPYAIPAGFDAEAAVAEREAALLQQRTRVASLVTRPADEVAVWLPELALSAAGATWLVPVGDASVVVTDAPNFPQWNRTLLPVIAIVARDDRTELLVWTKRPLGRRRGVAERLVGSSAPEWGMTWDAPPDGISTSASAASVQQALRVRGALSMPDELVRDVGWGEAETSALRTLWEEDHPVVTPARVAAAIGAPAELARLASGELDAARMPGARERQPTSARRTVVDAVIAQAEPRGTSLWARWQHWWWRRPRIATITAVVMLVLAAVLAGAMVVGSTEHAWWRWLVVAGLGVSAVELLVGALLLREPRVDEATDRPT